MVEVAAPDLQDPNLVAAWDDAHRYTPAPRHRRRLLLKMIEKLDFDDVLDAGCAQPFLLADIVQRFGAVGFGCDLSDRVIDANRHILPCCEFLSLDLTQTLWPGGRQFDLVVCSEVLEHLPDWQSALANIASMTRKHLLISVPGGPRREMDKIVGHIQHFQGPELTAAIEAQGLRVERVSSWGWPLHSAYKAAISMLSPDRLYTSFSGGGRYGFGKQALSEFLYRLFFLNDLCSQGHQLFILARVPQALGGTESRPSTCGQSHTPVSSEVRL